MNEEENEPVIMLEASAVIDSYFKNPSASVWIDSIIDVWDFVWVDTDEEKARTAETLLSIDYHEIVEQDFPDSVTNPIVWFTTGTVDEYDHAWCEDRNSRLPTLYVEVDPVEGITRQDVDLASAFISYLEYGELSSL